MRVRSVSILVSVAVMLTLTMGMDGELCCSDLSPCCLLDGLWFAAGAAAASAAATGTADGDQAGQPIPGEPGAQGEQGDPGPAGAQGAQGEPGADGLSCWDLNGNGVADPEEDINADGDFNALDCRGADGQPGAPGEQGEQGEPGLSCWDLNGNGVGEPEEDINGDGNFDALDCQGAPGEPAPFQVVASGVIDDAGVTLAGNNILYSARLDFGLYEVVFDVSEVEIPEGAEAIDFPVFITVIHSEELPTPDRPIAAYVPVSLEDGELTVEVHIRGPYNWPLNSGFSIQVLEPGS